MSSNYDEDNAEALRKILPLIPEEVEYSSDRTAKYKALSDPADNNSIKYDFIIHHHTGNEGLRDVDDLVLVLNMPNRKYGNDKYQGPFKITQVNENGTVCVRVPTRSGAVITTWNVRNVRPYTKSDPLP